MFIELEKEGNSAKFTIITNLVHTWFILTGYIKVVKNKKFIKTPFKICSIKENRIRSVLFCHARKNENV